MEGSNFGNFCAYVLYECPRSRLNAYFAGYFAVFRRINNTRIDIVYELVIVFGDINDIDLYKSIIEGLK